MPERRGRRPSQPAVGAPPETVGVSKPLQMMRVAVALVAAAAAAAANPADMLDQLQPQVPAAPPPGVDTDTYPQMGNTQLVNGPGMPLNPQLPSNYNFAPFGSPQISQTAEGAQERGRLEGAAMTAQGKEAAEFEHMAVLFARMRATVREAEHEEQDFTTDPAKVNEQAARKDRVANLLAELPSKFEAVEVQRAEVVRALGDTKDRVSELATYLKNNGN